MAVNAGYERFELKYKSSGRSRYRTRYSEQFTDTDVSIWMLFFSGHFINRLSKEPKLQSFFVDIVNKCFFRFFQCFDLETFNSKN